MGVAIVLVLFGVVIIYAIANALTKEGGPTRGVRTTEDDSTVMNTMNMMSNDVPQSHHDHQHHQHHGVPSDQDSSTQGHHAHGQSTPDSSSDVGGQNFDSNHSSTNFDSGSTFDSGGSFDIGDTSFDSGSGGSDSSSSS